jgi:hypothetical protein
MLLSSTTHDYYLLVLRCSRSTGCASARHKLYIATGRIRYIDVIAHGYTSIHTHTEPQACTALEVRTSTASPSSKGGE